MRNRVEFGSFLTSLGLVGKGVEVGTYKGEFAKTILDSWAGVLYMVDTWRKFDNGEYEDITNSSMSDHTMNDVQESIRGYEDRAFMLRGKSELLVDLFDDNSLDFVYVDANHSYESVKQDLDIWYPKIKSGGVLSGHDYILFDGEKTRWYLDENFAEDGVNKHIWIDGMYVGLFGVNPAVDEFGLAKGLDILVTDEWSSSWYLIKK